MTRPFAPNRAAFSSALGRRDLMRNLVRAQLSSRYRTTSLGFLWFLLTPLLWAVILSVVFKVVIPLDIPNYAVFVLSGLLPWTYFSSGVSGATTSISRATNLVKRVRMPRIFLPLSDITSMLIHFLASLLVLGGLMLVYGMPFQSTLLLLPFVVIVETMCIIGVGLIGASLNVFYRDVEMLLNAGMRGLFYLTPTFYPLSFVPPEWRQIYLLNPMAGVIDAYREVIVNGTIPALDVIVTSTVMSAVLLIFGAILFVRKEPAFEDHL